MRSDIGTSFAHTVSKGLDSGYRVSTPIIITSVYSRYHNSKRFKVTNSTGKICCATCENSRTKLTLYKRVGMSGAKFNARLADIIMLCKHCRNKIYERFKEVQHWGQAISSVRKDYWDPEEIEVLNVVSKKKKTSSNRRKDKINKTYVPPIIDKSNIYKGRRVLESLG